MTGTVRAGTRTPARESVDVLVRGGSVVDGTGAEPRRADVGVVGTRVVAVGDLTATRAGRVVDATGCHVLPGLVDAHSHAGGLLAHPDVQEACLRQGITTVVLGQDGVSCAPTGRASARYAARYFAAVDGAPPAGLEGGARVADLLAALDRCGDVNAAVLVPAGVVRAEVVGLGPGPATSRQVAQMREVVDDALAAGAVGLSTGLEYVPGAFASADELAAVAAPVGERGGVYVSHLRSYATDRVEAALREAADIARRSGAAGHVSHLHGRADVVEPVLERLAAEGTPLTFDAYPYLRGSTILAMVALPPGVQAGGIDATLARLRAPSTRDELRRSWFPSHPRIATARLSFVADPAFAWAEGLSVAEAGERYGRAGRGDGGGRGDLVDLVCDLLAACDLAAGCVMENAGDRDEADLRRLLRSPGHMAGSDGILLGSRPHPRGWGTAARLLARHVRELGDWTWGEAAWHLSGHAAHRFGLAGRGMLAPGAVADVVVLDPAQVRDVATYDDPRRPAVGVRHVLVGGSVVLDDGRLTPARAGRAVRAGRDE